MEQLKEEKQVAKPQEELVPPAIPGKGLNVKILIIGIPVFIIQLIAVYFITANILLNRIKDSHATAGQTISVENKQNPNPRPEQAKTKELGKFVYMVEDLIINPANTDGKRLLLSSLGFDVPTEQDQQELKSKDVLLKDAIIQVMSGKGMAQLGNISYRDTLRVEITNRLNQLMPKVKINTIYFSKYILQ
jgi:flagellar FliL protein